MKIADYKFTYREKDGGIQLILNYKVGKKWRQKSRQGFRTKREANAAKDDLLIAANQDAAIVSPHKKLTLQDFILGDFLRDQQGKLEPATIRSYKVLVKIFPHSVKMPIRDITYGDLMQDISELKNRGLKPTTINQRITLLKRIFRLAMNPYHVISHNPAADLMKLKVPQSRQIKALTRDQLTHLIHVAQNTDHTIYAMCALAGYAGLRVGEILALTWEDIDFANASINVDKQIINGIVKRPKSENSVRTIPAAPVVILALSKFQQMTGRDTGRIFHGSSDTLQHRANSFIAGVYAGFHIHCLRHTFATLILQNGADIKTLAALIGDTPQIAMKTYIHYTDDLRKQASQIVKTAF